MKPRLYNHEKKMSLINQMLYKRKRLALKKLRIQQQQQQAPPINITINNTGFEKNNRLKEIYRRLEMIVPTGLDIRRAVPQERDVLRDFRTGMPFEEPPTPTPPDAPTPATMRQWVRSPKGNYMVLYNGNAGRHRVRMDDAEGRTTNIVESARKPDFV